MVEFGGQPNIPTGSIKWKFYLLQSMFYLGSAVRVTVNLINRPYQYLSECLSSHPGNLAKYKKASSKHKPGRSALSRMRKALGLAKAPEQFLGMDIYADDLASSVLVQGLTDPNPETRKHVLRTLEDSVGEQSGVLIVDRLHDPDPEVRCMAAQVAARLKIQSSVFSLIMLLGDDVLDVRNEAKGAIQKITSSVIDFDPNSGSEIRKQKIEQVKTWWKEERFSRLAAEIKTSIES